MIQIIDLVNCFPALKCLRIDSYISEDPLPTIDDLKLRSYPWLSKLVLACDCCNEPSTELLFKKLISCFENLEHLSISCDADFFNKIMHDIPQSLRVLELVIGDPHWSSEEIDWNLFSNLNVEELLINFDQNFEQELERNALKPPFFDFFDEDCKEIEKFIVPLKRKLKFRSCILKRAPRLSMLADLKAFDNRNHPN